MTYKTTIGGDAIISFENEKTGEYVTTLMKHDQQVLLQWELSTDKVYTGTMPYKDAAQLCGLGEEVSVPFLKKLLLDTAVKSLFIKSQWEL